MILIEIILIGIALSADALSVTICNILANPHISKKKLLTMPLLFGLFQGCMTIIGFYAGNLALEFVETHAGIISFVLLTAIGGKMIWDAFHEDENTNEEKAKGLPLTVLIIQAIATSIDALGVGVSFSATMPTVIMPALVIALCTFTICLIALAIGRKFGSKLGTRAEIAGGFILILIGLHALLF